MTIHDKVEKKGGRGSYVNQIKEKLDVKMYKEVQELAENMENATTDKRRTHDDDD